MELCIVVQSDSRTKSSENASSHGVAFSSLRAESHFLNATRICISGGAIFFIRATSSKHVYEIAQYRLFQE